eukprot:jgi/Hompol1/90/HPOL_005220-RA
MENYQPLEAVGSGSFGIIRKVRRLHDGKVLARKEIDYRKMTEKEKKQLVAEVNILRELRHPNIVRYYERFVDRKNSLIFIVMGYLWANLDMWTEYCEGGDLAAVIRRCKKEGRFIPEDVVWNLLSQLLLALQECHMSDRHPTILHRDIKPDNVFLDKLLNVKLGDFGLSRMVDNPESDFAKTFVGTPFYMSPELVQESRYNAKSDIWALGCLIFELCALEPPFQANTQQALTAKIKAGKTAALPSQYGQELRRVIQAMLTVDHEKRPSTQDMLAIDRIKLSIREQHVANSLAEIKRREEELNQRQADLDERERWIANRERELESLLAAIQPQQIQQTHQIHHTLPMQQTQQTQQSRMDSQIGSLASVAQTQSIKTLVPGVQEIGTDAIVPPMSPSATSATSVPRSVRRALPMPSSAAAISSPVGCPSQLGNGISATSTRGLRARHTTLRPK